MRVRYWNENSKKDSAQSAWWNHTVKNSPNLLPHALPPKRKSTTRFIIKSQFFENSGRVFIFIPGNPVLRAENRVKPILVPGRLCLL
jgi:hypothetical protein